MVGRAESLHVEFHRGVDHALRGVRELFQFGMMRGDQGRRAAFEQPGQDGARQGRALLRVGACAEFVEDDKRAVVGFFQNVDDVGDVTAEGAERLLDGLLVADVGVDCLEETQLGAALRGDVESALRHEDDEPDGFQRDGFSARVGTRDDDGMFALGYVEVNRDDGGWIEEGMASMKETEDGRRMTGLVGLRSSVLGLHEDRLARVNLLRVFRFGEGEVEQREGLHAPDDLVSVFGDEAREFGQDAAFLVALLQLQFAQFVVGFHHVERFDEERRAAGTLVVDDGLDLALVLGAQGDDVASVALGDEIFLQQRRGARVGEIALEARHQAVVRDADLAAERSEFGRGGIQDLAALGQSPRDGVHQSVRVGQAAGDFRKMRIRMFFDGGRAAFGRFGFGGFVPFDPAHPKRLPQLARRNERGLDVEHPLRVNHAAAPRQLHRGTHVVRAAHRRPADGEQQPRFGRLGEETLDLFEAGGRLQLARQFHRSGERAVCREAVEDLGIFEDGEGLGVHDGEL
ncbi:MAG: hypothetical protein PGMFKBFP_03162 [Anaerolineales bacterium]|nr:hypothetical protein [Anaerolineales bacterium]